MTDHLQAAKDTLAEFEALSDRSRLAAADMPYGTLNSKLSEIQVLAALDMAESARRIADALEAHRPAVVTEERQDLDLDDLISDDDKPAAVGKLLGYLLLRQPGVESTTERIIRPGNGGMFHDDPARLNLSIAYSDRPGTRVVEVRELPPVSA